MKHLKLIFSILLNIFAVVVFAISILKEEKYIPPTQAQYEITNANLSYSNKLALEPRLTQEYFDSFNPNEVKPEIHAWIPSWGIKSGIKSIEENGELFASVSPVFYELGENGLVNVNKTNLEELKKIADEKDVQIIPAISSFNAGNLTIVLNDEEKLQRHVDFLLKEVEENSFDGLDINYEEIYLKDKEKFFTLVKKLSDGLKSKNKIFSITVLSKWGDNIKYGYLPETREVMDYAELSKYCDQLRIMTYDFTGRGSLLPGPIAPEEWVRQVIEYAAQRVPREKIVLGTHLYGYVWSPGNSAKAYDFRELTDIKLNNNTTDILYSEKNKESVIKFVENGELKYGYYADKKFIEDRIKLSKEYGIKGLVFWRLGNSPI